MTNKQLKHIIKLCGDRIGAGYSYKQTYTIDEHGHVHFKVYFKELMVPKELIIENANILTGFSNLDDLKEDYEFSIEDVNLEDGYIQIYPEDQQFKIVKNYKDTSKVKAEDCVALNKSLYQLQEVAAPGVYVLEEDKKKALMAFLLSAGVIMAGDKAAAEEQSKRLKNLLNSGKTSEYITKVFTGPSEKNKITSVMGYPVIANLFIDKQNEGDNGLVLNYDSAQVKPCIDQCVPEQASMVVPVFPESIEFQVDGVTNAPAVAATELVELQQQLIPEVKKLQGLLDKGAQEYNKLVDELVGGFQEYAKGSSEPTAEQKEQAAQWATHEKGWVVGAISHGIMISNGIQEVENTHLLAKMKNNLVDYAKSMTEGSTLDVLEKIGHTAFDSVLGGLMGGVDSGVADDDGTNGTSLKFKLKKVEPTTKEHEKEKRNIEKPNPAAIAMYVFSNEAKDKVNKFAEALQPSDELKAFLLANGKWKEEDEKKDEDKEKKEGDSDKTEDANPSDTTQSSDNNSSGDGADKQ